MKRVYKFFSRKFSVVYFVLATWLMLIAVSFLSVVIIFGVDEMLKAIFCVVGLIISSLIVYAFAIFTLFARFEFDFEKEEIYVLHAFGFSFVKLRLGFREIKNVEVSYYNEVLFDLFVSTNEFTKKIRFTRFYINSVPTKSKKAYVQAFHEDLNRLMFYINKYNSEG